MHLRSFFVVSLLCGALGAQSTPDEPFTPGERWNWSSDPAAPWIPRSVRYVGQGEWVLAAPSIGDYGVALLASAESSGQPLHLAWDWAGATGAIEVRSAGPPRGLFALGGFPGSGGRRYELRRYDGEAAARGAGFVPAWTRDLGFRGRVLFETDTQGHLALAAESASSSIVEIRWIDATTGNDIQTVALPGSSLRAFSVSGDGSRAAVLTAGELRMVDANGVFATWTTAGTRMALDESGARLAFSDAGRVQVTIDTGAGFQPAYEVFASGTEVAGRVAWSRDGSTLAVAWWDPSTTAIRVTVYDDQGTTLFEGRQPGGVWQNFPAALRLSDNGERLAVGTWGAANSEPELFLVDVPTQAVLLAEDLGGSVEDLDLSPDGTRVVVAFKSAHANQLATTGSVVHFDSGERDLVLTAATRVSGVLSASLELPAPGFGVFGLGIEGATPFDPFGVGNLFFDMTAPIMWSAGQPNGPLRSDLSLLIPNSSAVVGVAWLLQAGGVTAAGPFLANSILRPRVL